ncbi:aspartic peptidase domain-containing protein [Talaromyces proteolyticus]|uniref:Aspartic peptidase domain-containing protein n=1 Tax=Talaromyces proteolyticus TaxID=1131652 RepID=A0AAD4PXP5_9EURO|nr:aspartic peptidase domain-containing protein [Talaromyces proteolyticus]KAH8696619.1 aspartic peptidase domain-containing protein [Talaromyces proteolyticus]
MLYHANGQKPLQEEANLYGDWKLFQPNGGIAVLDVTNNLTIDLGYFIQVGFGTPAQRRPVMLDTSSLNTFILSVNCNSCAAATDDEKGYNSSTSSTHKDNGTLVDLDYIFLTSSGRASQDSMALGQVEIQDQWFQESLQMNWRGVSYDDVSIIYGILGLGNPHASDAAKGFTSLLKNAAVQGILETNIFGLKLADPGQLMIGDVNQQLFHNPITWFPLSNTSTKLLLPEAWQTHTGAGEVKIALPSGQYREWRLDGYTALFTSAWPYIYLDPDTAVGLMELLGFDFDQFLLPPNVPCAERVYMPDVSLTIAGHTFTLSPYDYTIEWTFPGSPMICVSAFSTTDLEEDYDPKQIILGSAFLRKYYSIYNYDSKAVGFASLV